MIDHEEKKNPQPWRGKIVWGKKLPSQRLASPSSFFLSLSERERERFKGEVFPPLCMVLFPSLSFFLPWLCLRFSSSPFPPLLLGRGEKKEVAEKELLNVCAKPFYPNVVFFFLTRKTFFYENVRNNWQRWISRLVTR